VTFMFEKLDEMDFVRKWEEVLRIPYGQTSAYWVPTYIGRILEMAFDAFIEPAGGKFVKTASGIAITLIPGFVPGMKERDIVEFQGIGRHLATEIADPSPEELSRIAEAISELRLGITFGDWSRIARAFGFKSPEQITREWTDVINRFSVAFGIPTPTPAGGAAPPMVRETLTSPTPPATQAPQPPAPGLPVLFRMTSDTLQPAAPAVPKKLFKLTLA